MKPETVKSIFKNSISLLSVVAKTSAITYALNALVAAEFGLNPFGFVYVFICLFAVDIVTGKEHDYMYTDDDEKIKEYFSTIMSSGLLSLAVYIYQ